ncbi:hypothetical protein [Bifidobacterium favimelis]|uniref:Antitoxin VbhA domain-containing protein n=1 Tax=Bifidobacterium favimelis TaxID=3122979 RepID=A0ABU8ZL58_9BIFI
MISKEESEARARAAREAIHSTELEGGYVTEAFRADVQDYIDGKIDAAGLATRTRARYGADRS